MKNAAAQCGDTCADARDMHGHAIAGTRKTHDPPPAIAGSASSEGWNSQRGADAPRGGDASEVLTVLDVRRARLIVVVARRIERRGPQVLRTDAELAAPRRTPRHAEIERGPALARERGVVTAEDVTDDRAAQRTRIE